MGRMTVVKKKKKDMTMTFICMTSSNCVSGKVGNS